ncbi:hypothetical protein, partial [Paenarthrobacter sp. NCHU4564]|uniref:hypothetical protein n=1 Tax=Paenarthrobacter sp. NCHU4564 TaxID=3451353 RepID=UPI003F96B829
MHVAEHLTEMRARELQLIKLKETMIRRYVAAFAATTVLAAGVFAAQLAVPSAARAEAPPTAATTFDAPLCPGTTVEVANPITTVDGANLDNYNQGLVVPLYNVFGDPAGGTDLPPLCGVRYSTEAECGPIGGGPVSAWMFCTDRDLETCHDGRPLDEDLERNADMTDTQRRQFAYIVQHGFQYVAGDGTVDEFVTSDTTSIERQRLQALAWCVADFAKLTPQQQATCVASKLGPDDIDETLGFLAQTYTPELTIDPAASGPYDVGAEAKVTLNTNVVKTPIELSSSNGTLQLCDGETDGTLSGGTLTVNEPAAVGDTVAVDLCITATTAGTVTLNASVLPTTDATLNWFHNGDDNCQVYAVFTRVESHVVTDGAEISFQEPAPTPTPTPTPTPSETPTETPTPTPTPTPSEEPTETPTPTPSEEPTETPTPTPSEEPTETPTPTPSEEPTETPTPTPTPSEEPTETPTPTPTPSETPTETPTPTPTPSETPTET